MDSSEAGRRGSRALEGGGKVLQICQNPEDLTIDFFVTGSGGDLCFYISYGQRAGPEVWERFVDACRSEKKSRLDWEGQSKGGSRIVTSAKRVMFIADIAGDGWTMTSFAKEACVCAFEDAVTVSRATYQDDKPSARVKDI